MSAPVQPRNVAVTALLGVAAIGYTWCVFLPTHRGTCALQGEIAMQQDYIAQSVAATTATKAVECELAAARDFARQWRQNAATSHTAAALGAITREAAATRVNTVRFNPGQPEPLATIQRVPVTFVCTGTFSQVFDLVRRLEQLPQTVWVQGLAISADEGDRDGVICEVDLVIVADNSEKSR